MIYTLTDNHTKNIDEQVALDVEVLAIEHRALHSIRNSMGRDVHSNLANNVARLYDDMNRQLDKESLDYLSIGILNNPTIIVRGTKINSDILFTCTNRSIYVGYDTEGHQNGYKKEWQINIMTSSGYCNLTTYQKEQLLLRYKPAIMAIIEDPEWIDIIKMYTRQKWMDTVVEQAKKNIIIFESVIERVDIIKEEIEDEDTDNEEV
jgi:hypothetical protein